MTSQPDFVYGPLGPDTDDDGEWCCGLLCSNGGPCPYKLKIKPKQS